MTVSWEAQFYWAIAAGRQASANCPEIWAARCPFLPLSKNRPACSNS